MRVGIVSDTHIPLSASQLPIELLEGLRGVDLILHAGDLVELSVLDELKKIAPTEGVSGNMDSPKISKILPEKKVLELGGFKIGLIHGNGSPDGLLGYVRQRFEGEKLDCIVYGHAHKPSIDEIDGTLLFNPGSPTDKVFAPYNSYGILDISDKINPKIVRMKE